MLIIVVAAIGGGGVGYRDKVIETWPAATKLYAAVGLGPEVLGFGLSLVNITFDRKTDKDANLLLVEGQIENRTTQVRSVPGLRASLYDEHQRELQHWIFPAPVPRLLPGENVAFHTQVENPADSAVRLTIIFSE